MTGIDAIRDKLSKYPDVVVVETASSIEVQPRDESGFSVTFIEQSPRYTVHFDGWHEHFSDLEEALNCFAFGLSSSCRLAVTYRGATPVRWELQVQDGDSWLAESVTGFFFVPFWRPKTVSYLQNHAIE